MEDYTRDRLAMLANGYSPIPAIDKITNFKGWPTIDITEDRIHNWDRIEGMPSSNLRIENGLAVFDFDIEHESVVELYNDLLDGWPELDECLFRVGKAPKEAWFFRAEQMYPRRETAVYTDGTSGFQVESWGGLTSRQMGAVGWHTLGERRYRWVDDASPVNTPLADLPMLSYDTVIAIMRYCERWLADRFERHKGEEREVWPEDVYDLTPDMVFVTHEDGEVSLDQLRELAGGSGYYRCSASFIDGPIAQNTRRCSVSIDHHGGVAVWDADSETTHHEQALEPRDQNEVRSSIADRLRALGAQLPEPETVPLEALEQDEDEDDDEDEALLRGALQFSGNKLVNNLHNVQILAMLDEELAGALGWDKFQHKLVALRDIERVGVWEGDVIDAKLWPRLIAMVQGAEPARSSLKPGEIKVGLAMEAEWSRGYHPLQDYLRAQTWDGQSRIEELITRTLCTEADEVTIEMVKRWLVQAVDRGLSPGCQADHALILTGGAQGEGKSSFFRHLVPNRDWHVELSKDNAKSDRLPYLLAGKWIIDYAELSALKGRESEHTKAFLTALDDHAYVLYQGEYDARPRTCVFGGNTNEAKFLTDPTGNRRYWPVNVPAGSNMDIEWLKQNRDQLWAEAVALHRAGCRTYIGRDEPELFAALIARQMQFFDFNEDVARIVPRLRKVPEGGRIKARELYDCTLNRDPKSGGEFPKRAQRELADMLRSLGWVQHDRVWNGVYPWIRGVSSHPDTDPEVSKGEVSKTIAEKLADLGEHRRRRKSPPEEKNEKSSPEERN
jgi:hypothetical protein